MSKFNNANSLGSGLKITSNSPIDDRVYFEDVQSLQAALPSGGSFGMRLHDGIKVMVGGRPAKSSVEDYTEYIWMETEKGLLDTAYTYGKYSGDYADKVYNLVPVGIVEVTKDVPAGATTITVEERFLPVNVRRSKMAAVMLREPNSDGGHDMAIPDDSIVSDDLTIHIAPYTKDTKVKIKIY